MASKNKHRMDVGFVIFFLVVMCLYAGCSNYLYGPASGGQTEKVRRLLEAGADVDATPHAPGKTALRLAAVNNHPEVVKVLLEAGADVNIAAKDGTTPLYKVLLFDHSGDYDYTEVVKLLVEAGADANLAATNGRTPLFEASKKGHTKIINLLKQYGAKD